MQMDSLFSINLADFLKLQPSSLFLAEILAYRDTCSVHSNQEHKVASTTFIYNYFAHFDYGICLHLSHLHLNRWANLNKTLCDVTHTTIIHKQIDGERERFQRFVINPFIFPFVHTMFISSFPCTCKATNTSCIHLPQYLVFYFSLFGM